MLKKINIFFEMIKFEHTVFALPFAYLGMLVSSKSSLSVEKFSWITIAMISARTAAMTANRIIDRHIDGQNPRTQSRALVTGDFLLSNAWAITAVMLVIFFLSAWFLNELCFKLSFVAIIFLTGYHYVKRFSFLSHFALGIVLAMAPMGGWIAVTGHWAWPPVFLAVAVFFWVAGFDILYSLQDLEFDKTHKLHSIPVKFGQVTSLKISEYCHWVTVIFLIGFGVAMSLGVLYWVGVATVAALLKMEHVIISDGDLKKINTAFFTINGWIGIFLLIFTFLEIFR